MSILPLCAEFELEFVVDIEVVNRHGSTEKQPVHRVKLNNYQGFLDLVPTLVNGLIACWRSQAVSSIRGDTGWGRLKRRFIVHGTIHSEWVLRLIAGSTTKSKAVGYNSWFMPGV